MSVLQNFPFVPQNQEQAKAVNDRRDAMVALEAEGKSNRFIAVRLVELFAPEWRERIGPLRTINVLKHRLGVAGNKVQVEAQVRDGYEYFDYDSQTGQHISWIYDDDAGYNRELLASHFYNGLYEIMELPIRKEIEVLAEQKKLEVENRPEEGPEEILTDNQINEMSVDSIEQQIEYLKQRKVALLKQSQEGGEPVAQAAPAATPTAPNTNSTGKGKAKGKAKGKGKVQVAQGRRSALTL